MSAKSQDRLSGVAGSAAISTTPSMRVAPKVSTVFEGRGARVEQVVDDDGFGGCRCAHVGVSVFMCAYSFIGAHPYAHLSVWFVVHRVRVSMYTGRYAMRVSACVHNACVAIDVCMNECM